MACQGRKIGIAVQRAPGQVEGIEVRPPCQRREVEGGRASADLHRFQLRQRRNRRCIQHVAVDAEELQPGQVFKRPKRKNAGIVFVAQNEGFQVDAHGNVGERRYIFGHAVERNDFRQIVGREGSIGGNAQRFANRLLNGNVRKRDGFRFGACAERARRQHDNGKKRAEKLHVAHSFRSVPMETKPSLYRRFEMANRSC